MKRFFSPEQKKAVFLDMNRTLLDPEKAFDQAFLALWAEFTGRWEGGTALTPADALARLRRELKAQPTLRSRAKTAGELLRLKALSDALGGAGSGFSPAMTRLFLQRVEERREAEPALYPGVRRTLEALAGRYTLAVISNGSRERQERHMHRLGLDSLIPSDRLFTHQKGGMRKPQPAIFLHALHSLKLTPQQGIMVGNSWKTDIAGAAGVGMDAVWIHPTHAKKSSLRKAGSVKIAVIRRFEQLTDLM